MSGLVYITKSNAEKILIDLEINFNEIDQFEIYNKDISFILTTREILYLYKAMLSYSELEQRLDIYKKQHKSIDTKSYVFEGGLPAYHKDPNCERLSSDFVNLKIPVEIQEKGDVAVQNFRDFCKKNIELLEYNQELFYKRLEAQFFLKNRPGRLKHNNSGIEKIENHDLNALELKINRLLQEASSFKDRDPETKKIITNQGYGTNRLKAADKLVGVLDIWHHKYKENIKYLLRDYLRLKYNPDLKFDGKLLDQLGFVPCKHCHNN